MYKYWHYDRRSLVNSMRAISFVLSIAHSVSVGGAISMCRSSFFLSLPLLSLPSPPSFFLSLPLSSLCQSSFLTILSVLPNHLSAWFGSIVSKCGTRPQHSGYTCGPALWPCRGLVGPSCKRENRESEAEGGEEGQRTRERRGKEGEREQERGGWRDIITHAHFE